eukprot:TRINITY_DN12674_c0_g1_i1.p1 TRINITY_DN12674_c0_g1~~TRINITY_DN12674_c0_g1_i1.p1  ORF type:complete len:856 (+),score=194.24 TRINITY_DN12674_c0_g1_i1:125-2569(+)
MAMASPHARARAQLSYSPSASPIPRGAPYGDDEQKAYHSPTAATPRRALTDASSEDGALRDQLQQVLSAGLKVNRRRCGVEIEDPQRDADVRLYALMSALFNLSGLMLNLLNYGLIPPPWLEDRDAGCAGCPNHDQPDVSDQETAWFIFFQVMVSVLTLPAMVFGILYYVRLWTDAKEKAARRSQPPPQFFGKGGWAQWALPIFMELCIVVPHPVVFYARRRGFVYVTCWMFLRLFTLARWLGLNSAMYRNRFDVFSQRRLKGKYTQLVVTWPGALRALTIRAPGTFMFFFTGLALLCSGVMVFYAERNGAGGPDAPVYDNLADSMWFTFITYTTIGYGDMYPGSNLGKLVTCIAGVIGVVVASMVAGVLAIRLAPTPYEVDMLQWLDKQKKVLRYQNAARRLIQSYWRDRRAAVQAGRTDLLPLGGKAWDPRRQESVPAAERLPGGWRVGDNVTAPALILKSKVRGEAVFRDIPKGTKGVVVAPVGAAKKRFVSVNWGGSIGITAIKPGPDIPNLLNECNAVKIASDRTKQLAHRARVARLHLAEPDGDSAFDAGAATAEMQGQVTVYSKKFKELEAQGRGTLHNCNQIFRESAVHRHGLHTESVFGHLSEKEWYARELCSTQELLGRSYMMNRFQNEAGFIYYQTVLTKQVKFIADTLVHQCHVDTTQLQTDLRAVKTKLGVQTSTPAPAPPPPPPPQPVRPPSPPRRTPTPSPRHSSPPASPPRPAPAEPSPVREAPREDTAPAAAPEPEQAPRPEPEQAAPAARKDSGSDLPGYLRYTRSAEAKRTDSGSKLSDQRKGSAGRLSDQAHDA